MVHFLERAFRSATACTEEHRGGIWLFLRLLGLCHLIAFVSLDWQVEGLIGEKGILPAQPWLSSLETQLGISRFWKAPTLCWLGASDAVLHGLCRGGAFLGALVTFGVAVRPCLIALWALYLSMVTAGTLFMGYQWDALLVEATFLAVFVSPATLRPMAPHRLPGPPRYALWAVGWLLFRLMFLSGAVKLLSEDKLWRGLQALTVHYQTQPLPTPLAWWAHHLPQKVHVWSCTAMFAIELFCPFLLLCGRTGRRVAAAAFLGLMTAVALTGNYCFFNLLVAALCLPVIDDRMWQRLHVWLPEAHPNSSPPQPARQPLFHAGNRMRVATTAAALALAAFAWCASATQTGAQLFRWRAVPGWVDFPRQFTGPFRIANPYGLFAVMTEHRPEIVLQGSDDGKNWKEYGFKWKASDPERAPRFVAPYQPRLDWQMWFAALGQLRNNPWFTNFMLRVLQAEPRVLALLDHNPFPEKPPRYLRALLFQYRFTSPEARAESGRWWERDDRGDYCPSVTLTPPK